MLRSLFAGISGLRVNQTMLDVTGNNIANANTTGFKASTVVFQDTLSQMLTGASGTTQARTCRTASGSGTGCGARRSGCPGGKRIPGLDQEPVRSTSP